MLILGLKTFSFKFIFNHKSYYSYLFALFCITFSETVLLLNISEIITDYRGWLPIESVASLCHKSSMNMSIDNRYCNRFIHIGRPIYSVNHSGAFVYNPDNIWECVCAVLHSWGCAHPICKPSLIIAARQLDCLTVPWSHNVSNNCIYIHSHLLRWYKLNYNRFNHCERPIFSCDQAALWMVQSVCPSARHTFLTMFPSLYHHEIFRLYYQWQKWHPCKRSKSEVKGPGH